MSVPRASVADVRRSLVRAWGRGDVFRGAAFRRARARTLGNGERKVLYTSCAALWRRFSCLCSVGAPFLAQRRTNGWHSASGKLKERVCVCVCGTVQWRQTVETLWHSWYYNYALAVGYGP